MIHCCTCDFLNALKAKPAFFLILFLDILPKLIIFTHQLTLFLFLTALIYQLVSHRLYQVFKKNLHLNFIELSRSCIYNVW